MPLLHCQKCAAELSADSTGCPHCGTSTPFMCAVCGEVISTLAEIGWAYPYTKDGKPLCPTHAQRLCDACQRPFPQDALSKRIARWEFFQTTGEYLQQPGYYCEKCNAAHVDPAQPHGQPKPDILRIGIYCLCAALIILLVLFWVLHRR